MFTSPYLLFSCVTCHLSHDMCQMSYIMSQVSHVTCQYYFFLLIGETSWLRVCYQQGLPLDLFFWFDLFSVLLKDIFYKTIFLKSTPFFTRNPWPCLLNLIRKNDVLKIIIDGGFLKSNVKVLQNLVKKNRYYYIKN